MARVRSNDGTWIAFEQAGQGPAVVLIGGALMDQAASAPLAELLSRQFTVFSYDRRGRGESGDTAPYAVAREVEDVNAVICEVGDAVCLFGHSSGAVLGLEAADQLPAKIKRLALYEPPFIVDDSRAPVPAEYLAELKLLLAEGRRGDTVEYFMNHGLDAAPDSIARAKEGPMWHEIVQLAHTLPYDAAIMANTMSGTPLSVARWASVAVPTLVVDERQSATYLRHAAEALTQMLPNAQLCTLSTDGPGTVPENLSPVLVEFFQAR
ncbi:MAG TPA: alpha/beta hydrolase [Polyangiaceae bacterium]|nr:alpha/beta hydrolase [Polyangiaceae bacterium]